jgi:hypothetical protein
MTSLHLVVLWPSSVSKLYALQSVRCTLRMVTGCDKQDTWHTFGNVKYVYNLGSKLRKSFVDLVESGTFERNFYPTYVLKAHYIKMFHTKQLNI